jgi:cell division protein FtsZ
MARKRASMREGPLADLFRSTEESLEGEEIQVKANGGGATQIEVAIQEPKHEAPETQDAPEKQAPKQKATKRAKEPKPKPKKTQPKKTQPKKPQQEVPVPEPVPEPTPEPVPEPIPDPVPPPEPIRQPETEGFVDPATDPAIGEIEKREKRAYKVVEKAGPEHEGLERLMGGNDDGEVRPAYGRDEPENARSTTVPRIHQAVLRVVGVGGAGVNAVNRMVEAQLPGVEFVAINTDLQSLQNSNADVTLHIGSELTRGLGSGSDPRVGYSAAFDEQDKIKQLLKGSDMVFLAVGAGGGTGTGAAPVVAKLARDVGALTVAAVTKPFTFEGARRAAQAEEGIAALGSEVDTLIVIPNERLLQILERRTSITDAFRVADDVLRQAVQGISDLVMLPGLINLDFADVRTTMIESGDAILGIGMGAGEHRALLAAEKAVNSPLLETSVEGAHSLLLSITGGPDLSLVEASEAANIVQEAAHPDANIIFGASIDEDMSEEVWITVIATRFETAFANRHRRNREDGPREPRKRDRDDFRTGPERAGDDRDRSRYADPVGDWRAGTGGPLRKTRSAEELYGDGAKGRGQDRLPPEPGTGRGGRVLDVPEFIPGH